MKCNINKEIDTKFKRIYFYKYLIFGTKVDSEQYLKYEFNFLLIQEYHDLIISCQIFFNQIRYYIVIYIYIYIRLRFYFCLLDCCNLYSSFYVSLLLSLVISKT